MMRKIILVAMLCALSVPNMGCTDAQKQKLQEVVKKNHDQIVAGIELAVGQGVRIGFAKWSEKDAAAAKEAGAKLQKNVTEVLLPYFSGEGKLPASAEVREFINSSLFKDLPDEVKNVVVAAATVLDVYLPAPGSDTFLKPEQVDYVKAFLNGVLRGVPDKSGADAFTAPRNKWITG